MKDSNDPRPVLISITAALDERNVIGHRQRLPWHLPGDLRHFRHLTVGKTILMGRRTLESIGEPLEKRRNLILTRQSTLRSPGFETVANLEEAIDIALCASASPELIVIGGALTYALALPCADRLYLTEVDGEHDGDIFFPDYDRTQWEERTRSVQHEPDGTRYSFVTYHRARAAAHPRGA